MSSVPTLNPMISRIGIPAALADLHGWLCWKFEHLPGEPKARKVPVYADGSKRRGRQGSTEDRARLVTYADAIKVAMARGWGVGFAPMPEWGVTALDFDNCVTAGRVHPDVERLVAGTYAELSPSGRGVRAFVIGQLGNRKDAHGKPFGFETFSSKGFTTVTGSLLPVCELTDSAGTVAEASPDLLAYCAQRFQREAVETPEATSDTPPLGLTQDQLQEALDVLDPSMPHEGWLRVGMALHHETSGQGFALWDQWSSTGSTYPGAEALQARWDSFGRGGQSPTTAQALVRMANANGARIDIAALEAADDFDVIPDTPESIAAAEEKAARFKVISADEFTGRPPPEWLIKGILPKAELVVLFGESGAGKSFVALDMAGALDRGVGWRGHRVKQSRVVYIAAEGAGGFRNRMAAYCLHNKISPKDLGVGVIHAAPNLLQKDDALDVCKAITAWGGADVVIVDTFAQTTPGANENAAEDMGKALAHCKGIHRHTGAVVMLVHHAGKDAARGARGWSGLKAAADAEIEITRGVGGRMLRTSKQKDGEDDMKFGFDLQPLPIGADADGDVITSCVVIEAELPAAGQVGEALKRAGPVTKAVIEVVSEIAESQTSGIELKAVIEAAAKRLPEPEDGKRDTRKQRCRRAVLELCEGDSAPYFLEGDSLSIV
jgi:RecA/RadA recombinase